MMFVGVFWGAKFPESSHHCWGEFPTGPGTWSLVSLATPVSPSSRFKGFRGRLSVSLSLSLFKRMALCWRERNQKKKNAIQRGWFCWNLESQPDFVLLSLKKMHAMIIVHSDDCWFSKSFCWEKKVTLRVQTIPPPHRNRILCEVNTSREENFAKPTRYHILPIFVGFCVVPSKGRFLP